MGESKKVEIDFNEVGFMSMSAFMCSHMTYSTCSSLRYACSGSSTIKFGGGSSEWVGVVSMPQSTSV